MDERQEFEQNYKLYKNRIYYMIGRYIADVCTIEDLTQHTFMKAWIHRQTFKGDSTYSTWLGSIAINTALNHIMYMKHKPQHNTNKKDLDIYTDGLDTLSKVISAEEFGVIINAINNIPPHLREPLILYVIYGCTYEVIAESLDMPINTVRTKIHRARYKLKELLR